MYLDTVAALLDICRDLLRIVEAQEDALTQLGAVTDAEGKERAKRRLAGLQGAYRPIGEEAAKE